MTSPHRRDRTGTHMMVVCLPQRQLPAKRVRKVWPRLAPHHSFASARELGLDLIARVGCHDGDLPFLCAPRRQRAVRAPDRTAAHTSELTLALNKRDDTQHCERKRAWVEEQRLTRSDS
eukprot:786064-Rhodomonas_salina.3